MRIDDFLGHENPDDHYEALGVPPLPVELTRREIIRYRARVQRYAEQQTALLQDRASSVVFMRLRKVSGKERKLINQLKGYRRSRFRDVEPFVSDTKVKKNRQFIASQKGRPYHMRETRVEDTRRNEIRDCRDTALRLIAEIDRRFPHLPPEDKPEVKGRPVVAPAVDEFL